WQPGNVDGEERQTEPETERERPAARSGVGDGGEQRGYHDRQRPPPQRRQRQAQHHTSDGHEEQRSAAECRRRLSQAEVKSAESSATRSSDSLMRMCSWRACAPPPTDPSPSSVAIPSAEVKFPSEPPPTTAASSASPSPRNASSAASCRRPFGAVTS